MKSPESLPLGSTLYVFREKLVPMWESFPQGGCWTFKLSREDDRLTPAWEKLVKSCIVDGLGSLNVAGIVLGSRPRDYTLSVWLVSGQTSSMRFEILERLKEALKLHEGDLLQYKDFKAAIRDDSSKLNAVTYRVKSDHKSAHAHDAKKAAAQTKYLLPDPVTGSFTFRY